ncbi:MAG: FKBP-type peptidyl-prolyl cis-trans isomerase [Saprospiraceae bacterium]|nr:FKBP-type peptidyl-prolyl cis-trans isomerase [Saprospiraceae bacterium]
MKRIKSIFSIFLLLIISSCENSDGLISSNYSNKFIVNEEGEPPEIGDLVKFSETVFLNEKEIFSTRKFGLKEIVLPHPGILIRPLPPNYEILFKMSKGDSVMVVQELKDLNNLPKGFTTEGQLKYVIKIIEITSKEKLVTTTKINKTTSNYPYQILKKTGNIVAQPGDRIRYREYRFVNNELEKETPMDQPLQASLPPRNTVPNPPPGNYEALLLGGIGDSLHLGQLLAGVDRLPKGLKETDTINYRIQIVDVFTPGEFEIDKILQKANSLQLKKETIARKKEVEKITLATIEKFNNGELEDDLNYTHSGLKYILHQKGKGKKVTPLQKVKVQYMGFLSDGKVFDTSFDDGNPIVFPLGAGKVIKGWDEGISKLTVGSSATFFIPYQLAYGIAGWPGKIPNKADLVFYIELISSY